MAGSCSSTRERSATDDLTNEAAELVEVMQLLAAAGPCADCFRTCTAVSVKDISQSKPWTAFRKAALDNGFRSALSKPMKLRGKIIGTMNFVGTAAKEVSARDAAVAQALADVATIGTLQERVIQRGHLMEEQLHRTLDSQTLTEQAKGVVANELSLSMDDALALLRKYARDRNQTIRFVFAQVSNRELHVRQISASART